MKNLQAVKHAQLKTVKGEPLLLKSVQMTGDLRGAMFEAHVPWSAGLPSLQETYLENYFKHHPEMLNESVDTAQYQLLMALMRAFCTITVKLWPSAVLTPTEV